MRFLLFVLVTKSLKSGVYLTHLDSDKPPFKCVVVTHGYLIGHRLIVMGLSEKEKSKGIILSLL